MLNPSTADDVNNDPTINRCIDFAKRWGYGSMEVVNLFAYRSTDPSILKTVNDSVGIENNKYIAYAAQKADMIVAAWGNNGVINVRYSEVMNLLKGYKVYCLGINKSGQSKHPLYIAGNTIPTEYKVHEK